MSNSNLAGGKDTLAQVKATAFCALYFVSDFLFAHKLAHITMTAFQIESKRLKTLKVLKSSNGCFSSHRHKANAHAKHSLLNGRKKGLLNHQGRVEKACHAVP